MALVTPEKLLPRPIGADERVVARAAAGRMAAVAIATLDAVFEAPRRGSAIVAEALRTAKQLHSAERRFVAEGVYAGIRSHRLWLDRLPVRGDGGTVWDGWLAVQRGEPIAVEIPADPVAALVRLGSIHPEIAAELIRSMADPVAFLAASHQRGPVALRAYGDRVALQAELQALGIETHPGAAPQSLVLRKPADIRGSVPFRDGRMEIQDVGSQLVGALACGPGTMLDLCAGAGGKALQAAASGATVYATDPRGNALAELEKRARRAGLRIEIRWNAHDLPVCDTVLVDAPCTGLGTLRRQPELCITVDGSALKAAAQRQGEILVRAAALTKPGGRLVYVTCSVARAENEDQIDRFTAEQPAWRVEQELRLRPEVDDTDGFDAFVLRRKGI